MQIILVDQNRTLTATELLNATLRTDLVPIPVSLEFSVISSEFLKEHLIEGTRIQIGDFGIELTLIKTMSLDTQTIKNGQRIGTIFCIATPLGCDELLKPTKKAVSLVDTSFNTAYRAVGAKIKLGNDLPLPNFISLKGQMATTRIARYLQQEAAVIRYKHGTVQVEKIDQLLKQDVVAKFDPSAVAWVDSSKLENLYKTSYVGLDKDGTTVLGDENIQNKNIIQLSGLDSRQLKNMSKVLLKRGVLTRPLNTQLNAGDLVQVGDYNFIILTVAHHVDTGATGAAQSSITKIWLATL